MKYIVHLNEYSKGPSSTYAGNVIHDSMIIEALGTMNIHIKDLKFINSGTYGGVYRSKELPGKIIKVQPMEDDQAEKYKDIYGIIQKNKPKHITRVFNCEYIKSKKPNKYKFFIIIREELESVWRKFANTDLDMFVFQIGMMQNDTDFKNKTTDKLQPKQLLTSIFDVTIKDDNIKNLDPSFIKVINDIHQALIEARDLGFKIEDLHMANVMWNPKEKIYKLSEVLL